MRLFLAGLFLLALAWGARAGDETASKSDLALVQQVQRERVALAARLSPTVCAVFRGNGGGSGVILTEDGLVLTNFHVTELASEVRVGLSDHRIHPAVVLGVDPSGDLSLIRLTEKRKWPHATLGDSDSLHQGDWVYAMGNPFLLASDFTPTVTLGVVSGIHRYQPGSIRGGLLYPDCIQTDASINPGNSGGPLFDFAGEVVGINGRISLRDRGRVNIGVGYAICSNQIKMCLPDLRAGKIVEHGTLNATVREIMDDRWPGGVRVTFDQILAPGAAHDAGIELGDALVSFQGVRVKSSNDFLRRISVLPAGRQVSLRVARLEKGAWKQRSLRIRLDAISLLTKAQKSAFLPPRFYLDQEVGRTLRAAREAIAPIGRETWKGTLHVAGRDPVPLTEEFRDGGLTYRFGDVSRVVTKKGGTENGKPLSKDERADLLERRAAIDDLVSPEGTAAFQSIVLTGGALVGGVTADRLEATAKDGAKRVYFVDLATGRVLREDLYAREWVRWISLVFSDWRKEGDLFRPHAVEVWDREKERRLQTIHFDSMRRTP